MSNSFKQDFVINEAHYNYSYNSILYIVAKCFEVQTSSLSPLTAEITLKYGKTLLSSQYIFSSHPSIFSSHGHFLSSCCFEAGKNFCRSLAFSNFLTGFSEPSMNNLFLNWRPIFVANTEQQALFSAPTEFSWVLQGATRCYQVLLGTNNMCIVQTVCRQFPNC